MQVAGDSPKDTPKDLSMEYLRSRFREIMAAWHPDRCSGTTALKTFQGICVAQTKAVLSGCRGQVADDYVDLNENDLDALSNEQSDHEPSDMSEIFHNMDEGMADDADDDCCPPDEIYEQYEICDDDDDSSAESDNDDRDSKPKGHNRSSSNSSVTKTTPSVTISRSERSARRLACVRDYTRPEPSRNSTTTSSTTTEASKYRKTKRDDDEFRSFVKMFVELFQAIDDTEISSTSRLIAEKKRPSMSKMLSTSVIPGSDVANVVDNEVEVEVVVSRGQLPPQPEVQPIEPVEVTTVVPTVLPDIPPIEEEEEGIVVEIKMAPTEMIEMLMSAIISCALKMDLHGWKEKLLSLDEFLSIHSDLVKSGNDDDDDGMTVYALVLLVSMVACIRGVDENSQKRLSMFQFFLSPLTKTDDDVNANDDDEQEEEEEIKLQSIHLSALNEIINISTNGHTNFSFSRPHLTAILNPLSISCAVGDVMISKYIHECCSKNIDSRLSTWINPACLRPVPLVLTLFLRKKSHDICCFGKLLCELPYSLYHQLNQTVGKMEVGGGDRMCSCCKTGEIAANMADTAASPLLVSVHWLTCQHLSVLSVCDPIAKLLMNVMKQGRDPPESSTTSDCCLCQCHWNYPRRIISSSCLSSHSLRSENGDETAEDDRQGSLDVVSLLPLLLPVNDGCLCETCKNPVNQHQLSSESKASVESVDLSCVDLSRLMIKQLGVAKTFQRDDTVGNKKKQKKRSASKSGNDDDVDDASKLIDSSIFTFCCLVGASATSGQQPLQIISTLIQKMRNIEGTLTSSRTDSSSIGSKKKASRKEEKQKIDEDEAVHASVAVPASRNEESSADDEEESLSPVATTAAEKPKVAASSSMQFISQVNLSRDDLFAVFLDMGFLKSEISRALDTVGQKTDDVLEFLCSQNSTLDDRTAKKGRHGASVPIVKKKRNDDAKSGRMDGLDVAKNSPSARSSSGKRDVSANASKAVDSNGKRRNESSKLRPTAREYVPISTSSGHRSCSPPTHIKQKLALSLPESPIHVVPASDVEQINREIMAAMENSSSSSWTGSSSQITNNTNDASSSFSSLLLSYPTDGFVKPRSVLNVNTMQVVAGRDEDDDSDSDDDNDNSGFDSMQRMLLSFTSPSKTPSKDNAVDNKKKMMKMAKNEEVSIETKRLSQQENEKAEEFGDFFAWLKSTER